MFKLPALITVHDLLRFLFSSPPSKSGKQELFSFGWRTFFCCNFSIKMLVFYSQFIREFSIFLRHNFEFADKGFPINFCDRHLLPCELKMRPAGLGAGLRPKPQYLNVPNFTLCLGPASPYESLTVRCELVMMFCDFVHARELTLGSRGWVGSESMLGWKPGRNNPYSRDRSYQSICVRGAIINHHTHSHSHSPCHTRLAK